MGTRNFMLTSILVLGLGGCGRDEDTPPENDTGTTIDDPSGDPTTDPTEPTTSGPDTMTSPSTTADTSGTDESSTGEADCLGADGCWNCDPETNEQILNHCTASECEPFPNTQERLPLLEPDGSLPPIP